MKLKRNWKPNPMMKPKGESKRSESIILQKPCIEKKTKKNLGSTVSTASG